MAWTGSSSADRELQVEVRAASSLGGSNAVYRMRAEEAMGKLMFAWCVQHRVAPEQVRFTVAGVEFGPDSSLASFGLQGQNAPVVLQAVPRQPVLAPSPARASAARPRRRYEPYLPIPPVAEAASLEDTLQDLVSDSDDQPAAEPGMAMPVDAPTCISDTEEEESDRIREPGLSSLGGPLPGQLGDADGPPLAVGGTSIGDAPLGFSEDEASTEISGDESEEPAGNESEDGFGSASEFKPGAAMRAGPAAAAPFRADASGAVAAGESPSPSEAEGDGEHKVRFRVVAPTKAGDNAVVITTAPDMPLEKLMDSWCEHHGLPRDAVRFLLHGEELSAEETPLALAIRSLIPEHLVGVTPLYADSGRPLGSRPEEVHVLALPRRRLGAPPLK